MENNITYETVKELWDGEFIISGDPQTEFQFNELFKPVSGVDDQGVNIFESNPDNFPITWLQFSTKRDQLLSELPLKLLREKRNKLLQETDWTSGVDVPEALQQKYTTYRQALRDITDTYTSLDNVVWPTKPE